MTRDETIAAIKKAANDEGIDPELYLAICTTESKLDPFAIRFEPFFKWTLHPGDWATRFYISKDTEEALQKFSYGASQVMGAVLREHGHEDNLALIMRTPEIPIRIGAKHLKRFLVRCSTEEAAVASYNAGSARILPSGMFENQGYVDKVFRELRRLRKIS